MYFLHPTLLPPSNTAILHLFEIGSGKIVIEQNADRVIEAEKKKAEAARIKRHAEMLDQMKLEEAQTQMQLLLTKLGKALGYDVLVAANDRGKSFRGERFSFQLPLLPAGAGRQR